jgi:type II secretory pathway pseudopilin PulG
VVSLNNQPGSEAPSSPSLRKEIVARQCAGITLIEVLIAIATVAVLIALLLPVIQKKREESAAARASANVTAMMAASSEYHRLVGSYPMSISQLFQFCGANPGSCSLDPQLATGRAGGYNVIMANTEGDFHIIAEPEFPGITGSMTLTIGPNIKDALGNPIARSTPTPGSSAGRQRAFNDIIMSGANAAVQLLALDPTSVSQIRAYTESSGNISTAFASVDSNHNGKVSISEVNGFPTSDPTAPTYLPVRSWLDQVYRDLRWDVLTGQERDDIGVTLTDLDTRQALLFSYAGLRSLTVIDWGDGSADEAVAKLNKAEAAEASGNLTRKAKFLQQYKNIIKQGAGTLLTSTNANTLTTIANTL